MERFSLIQIQRQIQIQIQTQTQTQTQIQEDETLTGCEELGVESFTTRQLLN